MKNFRILFFSTLFLLPGLCKAIEIEGVSIPESAQVENRTLHLNGAGVRTKFFFDIYLASLYLEQPSSSANEIINSKTTKRLTMDILYDEVTKEKLATGWEQGFRKNQSKEQMQALRGRLDRFNGFFVTVHKGNQITLDFHSDTTIHVRINGNNTGIISGSDFQQALLAVWLGKDPAEKGLKNALLRR